MTYLHSRQGPSGSGKTTILNIIAGHVMKMEDARRGGELYVNREQITDHRFMSLISGYCEQDDTMQESMTVEEAINSRWGGD